MKRTDSSRGKAILWVVFAIVVVGAGAVLLMPKRTPPPPPIVAAATPPPATPEPATPAPATPPPVVVMATPVPTPPPATPTPVPTPRSVDLATVARTPALWPAQVALVIPASFPISMNGRVMGEAKLPAGTAVRLVKVQGALVEVEHQTARRVLPAEATDLLARANAAFRQAGGQLPVAATPVPVAVVMPTATPAAKVASAPSTLIGQRLDIDVVRQRRSRIEGGDFDDKKEKIEMKVKVANIDTQVATGELKGELYVFAESILDRGLVKIIAAEEFPISLAPRAAMERVTEEVETAYDTTGARFGFKYEGWMLRVRDGTGTLVLAKSSLPTLLKNAEKATSLKKDGHYDRTTFKEKTAPMR